MSTFGPTITKGPGEEHKGTVIFLHGVGEAGVKAAKLAATLNLPHLKFVFPTAPVRPVTAIKSSTTAWFDAYDIDAFRAGRKDDVAINSTMEMVKNLVAGELKAGLDLKKIVLGGFSNGGHIALQYLLTDGLDPLGGVFCLSSAMAPQEAQNLPAAQKTTPVFLGAGDDDIILPNDLVLDAKKALEDAGLEKLDFYVYPGMKHVIGPAEVSDLKNWLLKILPVD